jgi:hypothetical protein
MQIKCPLCGKVGLLQTITPRFHRIRHSIITVFESRINGNGGVYKTRDFSYCRVSTEWALIQINAEREKQEAEYRRIMGIKQAIY